MRAEMISWIFSREPRQRKSQSENCCLVVSLIIQKAICNCYKLNFNLVVDFLNRFVSICSDLSKQYVLWISVIYYRKVGARDIGQ